MENVASRTSKESNAVNDGRNSNAHPGTKDYEFRVGKRETLKISKIPF